MAATPDASAVPSVAPAVAVRPAPDALPGRRTPTALTRVLEGRGDQGTRLVLDVLALSVALALVRPAPAVAVVYAAVVLLVLWHRGLYRRRLRAVILDGVLPVVGAVAIATVSSVALESLLLERVTDRATAVDLWLAGVATVGATRILLALTQRIARLRGWTERRALIVGAGQIGGQVAARLDRMREFGLRPVGFLDPNPFGLVEATGRGWPPVLGAPADLERVVRLHGVDHVVIAFSTANDSELLGVVRECDRLGVEVTLVPRLFEAVTAQMTSERLGGLPLLGLRQTDPAGWQFAVKHAFDRILAALLLLATAPLLAAIALAVRLESSGPVLFRQRRVGRDGQVFDLLKFRSMRPGRPEDLLDFTPRAGSAPGGVEHADRRTRVGTFLRRSSLDELPQLVNVLRGEMSLVGPRPERPEFVEMFSSDLPRYADRHRVRSGLTGWAQVHGLRGQTSLADRVEHDNWYIQCWSLGLDVKILLLTVLAVLRPAE